MYLNRDTIDQDFRSRIDDFAPELVLEREFNDGKAVYTDVYEYLKENHPNCKRAVWLIDTHVSYARHLEYIQHFDYVFMAISSYVDEFRAKNPNTFWLPVCYPYSMDEIRTNYRPITTPVIFVGNFEGIKQWFPERAEYIQFLQNHYQNKFLAVRDYDNMKTLIREAKVSFNYCIKDDMNFRVFESLGLGTELVTNDVTDLHKIKGLTERLSIYRDKQDLIRIIDSILDNTHTTNTLEAQEWIKDNHTLYQRYKSLLKMVMSGKQELF